jgi:hypothetical protein
MWELDPELSRQLEHLRETVRRRYQVPTGEWPVVFVPEFDAVLVVREWPGGVVTAYTMIKNEGAE